MFLHLGGKMIINTQELILVENVENVGSLEDWIQQKKDTGQQVVGITAEKPKSAIYTDQAIILSPISSSTLKKRLEHIPN